MRSDALGLFWRDEPPVKKTAAPKVKRKPPTPTWLNDDYLPGLEEALNAQLPVMSDGMLARWGELPTGRGTMVFDVEIYKNYFLAAFHHLESGQLVYVESDAFGTIDVRKLDYIMTHFLTVGFNSIPFDCPITTLALAGVSVPRIKEAVDMLIQEEMPWRDMLKLYKVKQRRDFNHIDLREVAPLSGSLKIYSGRLHAKRMQDLPFPPDRVLTDDQIAITRYYCCNDLANTKLMYESLAGQLDLRVQMSAEYNIDLRSKSDAQIAEYVIGAEVAKLTGDRCHRPVVPPGTAYRYRTPNYMQHFQTQTMRDVLKVVQDAKFIVADHGSIETPPTIGDLKVPIGKGVYTMGIGGLHSTEKKTAHISSTEYKLFDIDVTSYYPSIILNQGLFPHHMGQAFLTVYRNLVNRRISAKRAKQALIAASLKIVINGSYGKLGSKWSILYAPDLLVQVTMTGQLSLLLLIEWFEMQGIQVVSANTDGIVVKPHVSQVDLMHQTIKYWEHVTNFEMEHTEYSGLYSKDVNNYIAVKTDGSVKGKGLYANPWADGEGDRAPWMHKNPATQICVKAVTELLSRGTPVAKTIMNCTDLTQFVSVRSVRGGAVQVLEKSVPPAHRSMEELVHLAGFQPYHGGMYVLPGTEGRAWTLAEAYDTALGMLTTPEKCVYLGKSVRWYYATGNNGELVYAESGNKVAKSDGAKPLMDLPDSMPQDINYEWYITEAEKILTHIGYV
ncbi:hypothetical protein [Pseudomonas virus PBPA162]|uniref:Uncharacterized protein n=1 Tax=Pseudomonas virus PBPA162 TaxID=2588096 RepID=A0A4Y5TP84_9CAUD|nr:hypothetical protein PQC32_gp15 [Pseudomonas virus PBPA162]QDB70849.1 hypothetical protein [Pseudomonas virus PBPA162]